jgi:hypothetical protein
LAEQAANAAASGFPHGVSTSTHLPKGIGESGRYRTGTVQDLHDAGLHVSQTGSRKAHHTVELPAEVTSKVADDFNSIFTRRWP